MKPLPVQSRDEELIAYIDQWAALLEKGEYAEAFSLTDHQPEMNWTADLVRDVIKSYGEASPTQRVTLAGKPTDISQRKNVCRFPKNKHGAIGHIWYDLNIDGSASDLTATFEILEKAGGLTIRLDDIHVM